MEIRRFRTEHGALKLCAGELCMDSTGLPRTRALHTALVTMSWMVQHWSTLASSLDCLVHCYGIL